MNNKQLILAIAFLLINFLGKAQVTEPTIIANVRTTCEGYSNYEIPINTSRALLPTETITWSTNGLGDHLQVASDKMSATLLSSAEPGYYYIEVRVDNAENNEFATDYMEVNVIAEPEATLITPIGNETIKILVDYYDLEVADPGAGYTTEWFVREISTGDFMTLENSSLPRTTLRGLEIDECYNVEVLVSDDSGVCLSSINSGVICRVNRTYAMIKPSSNLENGICSSTLNSQPLILEGSEPQLPEAPSNEKVEWTDIDGALGNPGATYTSQSLIIDRPLPAGEYKIDYSITNDEATTPNVDRLILRVYDAPAKPVISGPTEVCEGSEEIYSVSSVNEDTDYTWSVSDPNVIISGLGSQDVTVAFDSETSSSETSTPVEIQVTAENKCGSSSPTVLNVEKSNCNVVGFNSELVENSYKLYPNPFTTSFNLIGIQNFQKVEVYNVSGQLVESYTSKNDLGEALPKGTYLVKIYTSQGIAIQKLLKH